MFKLKEILYESHEKSELYHVTDKKSALNILKNGTDLSYAGTKHWGAGAEQGKGFYLYKTKRDAINHAKEYNEEIILVFDRGISIKDFDIDYEACYSLASKFLLKNLDFVKQNAKELDITGFGSKDNNPIFIVKIGNRKGGIEICEKNDININDSIRMATIFHNIEKINKPLFIQFKKEYLFKARALKYNGQEKLFPIRIEDVQGNILTSQDVV